MFSQFDAVSLPTSRGHVVSPPWNIKQSRRYSL